MNLPSFIQLIESIAPPSLAEPWDNTGLLLEPRPKTAIRKILLTIDLTEAVTREACKARVNAVVAYHPPIFQPLKRLTRHNPMQRNLLDLAEAGIALYSPHTALDATAGGVNDWLAALAGDGALQPIPRRDEDGTWKPGSGRRNLLNEKIPVTGFVQRLASGLHTDYLRVALAPKGPRLLRDIAVCAGAGASALEGCAADAWITGEMSHHHVLAANAAGIHVILSEHTRTERAYLPVLKERILVAADAPLQILISRADRCPISLSSDRKSVV